jgi:integrase
MAKDNPNSEQMANSDQPEAREPTAREINKQISAELKKQKLLDRGKARGVGTGMGALARAQKKHPNNPKAQLAMFLTEYTISAGTGRRRPVSQATMDNYGDILMRAIVELKEINCSVRNVGEIGKKHCLRLIKHWFDQKHSLATVQNRISILRRFMTVIGKETALPMHNELKSWMNQNGLEVTVWSRTVSVESKAWEEHDVDLNDILPKVQYHSPITAIQLEIQAAFGLRMKESMQIMPRAADYGDMLRVVHGTKGGLPRDVRFDDDQAIREWQRDVLERAKVYADANRRGILAPNGKSLAQNMKHFYYQVARVGISKSGLGVTAHGLRHQYAARRYRAIAGHATPVSGDAPQVMTQDVIDADLRARRETSFALGHLRIDAANSYVGTLPSMEKKRKQVLFAWIERTEENQEFQNAMREAGIVEAWLGGSLVNGYELREGEALRLQVRTTTGKPLDDNTRFLLKQRLLGMYMACQ